MNTCIPLVIDTSIITVHVDAADRPPAPGASTDFIITVAVAAFIGGILLTAAVLGTCCGCILW